MCDGLQLAQAAQQPPNLRPLGRRSDGGSAVRVAGRLLRQAQQLIRGDVQLVAQLQQCLDAGEHSAALEAAVHLRRHVDALCHVRLRELQAHPGGPRRSADCRREFFVHASLPDPKGAVDGLGRMEADAQNLPGRSVRLHLAGRELGQDAALRRWVISEDVSRRVGCLRGTGCTRQVFSRPPFPSKEGAFSGGAVMNPDLSGLLSRENFRRGSPRVVTGFTALKTADPTRQVPVDAARPHLFAWEPATSRGALLQREALSE